MNNKELEVEIDKNTEMIEELEKRIDELKCSIEELEEELEISNKRISNNCIGRENLWII